MSRSIPGVAMMRQALRVLRAMIGAPDYQRYCDHMRRCHPATATISEAEFVDQQLSARYERPGSRCC